MTYRRLDLCYGNGSADEVSDEILWNLTFIYIPIRRRYVYLEVLKSTTNKLSRSLHPGFDPCVSRIRSSDSQSLQPGNCVSVL